MATAGNQGEFAGQTCLITGAARGLGRATAARLLQAGAVVLLCDKDRAAVEGAAAELGGAGAGAHGYCADVASERGVDALKAAVADRRVTVLVNNAGYYAGKPIREITMEDWDRVLDINLRSVFLMSRAFMDTMIAAGYGRIVNVASADAYVPKVTNCHYAVAKAGVVSLTRTFAQELAPHGVLVNGVSPGAIATETAKSQAWLAKRIPTIPLGRAAEPEDIAEVIAFLASPLNRFMVGESVIASGGILIA